LRSPLARALVRLLAIGVSAAGGWISYELTVQYLDIPREEGNFLADTCEAFATSSCEKVSDSHWGRFPFGAEKDKPSMPTAELGLFYFTAVLSWLVLIGGCTASRWWAHLIPASGTALGLGGSAYLDYVMWKELDYWCPLCLGAHVCSLLLFGFALLLWPRRPLPVSAGTPADEPGEGTSERLFSPLPDTPAGPIRRWPHWWMLVLTPMVAALAMGAEHCFLLWQEAQQELQNVEWVKQDNARRKALFRWENRKWQGTYLSWLSAAPIDIPIEGEPVRGPAKARHTIVIFSDFDCPACGRMEQWFKKYIAPALRHPSVGGARIIFKHWPICTDCNEYAFRNSHPSACKAARAAEAARIVGGDGAFWRMHDLLFERQSEWKKSGSFVELAREIGLDEEAFLRAVDSPEGMERIKKHIEEGENLGKELVSEGKMDEDMRYWVKVHGTPSIFINNKRLYTRGHTETWHRILGYPVKPKRSTSMRRSSSTGPAARAAPGSAGPRK